MAHNIATICLNMAGTANGEERSLERTLARKERTWVGELEKIKSSFYRSRSGRRNRVEARNKGRDLPAGCHKRKTDHNKYLWK